MRLIETQSKWGNGYRRAYYADGRKVSESEFDQLHASEMRLHAMPGMAGKCETTPYGFRTIWQSSPTTTDSRLAAIRAAIESESVSYGEIAELQAIAESNPAALAGDMLLQEWAGIPESEASA